MTFVSQNYFDIENYTQPIQAQVGEVTSIAMTQSTTKTTFINVEYTKVELFDTQFRIFDDLPEKEVEYTSCEMKLQTTGVGLIVDSQKIYASTNFFLVEKGRLYKRRVVTVFNVLEDFGGIAEAIALVMAPLVVQMASRSFNYDLVSRHMKVKKRNKKQSDMPTDKIDEDVAKSIFRQAHIYSVDKLRRGYTAFLVCPKSCRLSQEKKIISKIMDRGLE